MEFSDGFSGTRFSRRWKVGVGGATGSFDAYGHLVAERHCPLLRESLSHGATWATEYDLAGMSGFDLENEVFCLAVVHAEWLRDARRRDEATGRLLCENVVIRADGACPRDEAGRLVPWSHWALKLLYTGVGLLFGDFWVGEELVARTGERVARPPADFISIRSSHGRRDDRFFLGQDGLRRRHALSRDVGQNVGDEFGVPAHVLRDIGRLRRTGLFSKVLDGAGGADWRSP